MNRFATLAAVAALSLTHALGADFTYTQRTEITGGSMKQMMSMLGRFAKGINEPQTSTVYLKGGKMATHAAKNISIMDAEAGTMTSIDLDRKEYSVITFEEMLASMKKMSEKMQGNKDANAKMNMKVSVNDKGAGRTVADIATRNMLMKIDTDTTVTDKKSGKEVTMTSTIENDMHIGKTPGAEAFREFARAMQGKFPLQQIPMQAMMQGGIDFDGLKEAGKKMAELDGLPLFTVTRMIHAGMPGMPPPQQQSSAREEQPKPSAGDAVAGALGGRLGRFGGFGRKPKEEPKKPEPAPAPQAAPAANNTAANVLLEMTSVVLSFNNGAVNPSVFAVPAGFKEVENPMKKMAK